VRLQSSQQDLRLKKFNSYTSVLAPAAQELRSLTTDSPTRKEMLRGKPILANLASRIRAAEAGLSLGSRLLGAGCQPAGNEAGAGHVWPPSLAGSSRESIQRSLLPGSNLQG